MSMPKTGGLLLDFPATPGEEDAAVEEVRDVSAAMDSTGHFKWSAPAGTWEILRVGYTASGARVSTSSQTWQGLAIDYLDRAAFDTFWNVNVAPLLEAARPYELAMASYADLRPAYVRGLAYLQLHDGAKAADEFQKIVDDPGLVVNSIIGALSYLQLARAERMAGDRDAARTHYQDFLAMWKDADPGIPILKQAKAEYARLK